MKSRREVLLKRRAVYDVVREFITEFGYAPSVRQIAERIDARSTSVVRRHLQDLRKAGYVTFKDGEKRTLRLTNKPYPHVSGEAA